MIKVNGKVNFLTKLMVVFIVVSIFSLPKASVEATTVYSGGLTGTFNLNKGIYLPGETATVSASITGDFPDAYRVYSGVSASVLYPGAFNRTWLIDDRGSQQFYMYLFGSSSFTVPSVEKNYSMNLTLGASNVQASNGVTYDKSLCDLSGQFFCEGVPTVNLMNYSIADLDGYLNFSVKSADAQAMTLEPFVDNGFSRNGASQATALNPGESTQLLWTSSGVDYCMYNGVPYATTRTLFSPSPINLSPSATTTYSVTCVKN